MPQAPSTNGTGTHTVLLEHDTAPSPRTAQAATAKEVPVARKTTSPDGSPKIRDTFVRSRHAAGTFSSFAAGHRPSSSSPSPCPSPHHHYSSSLSSTHTNAHPGPAGSLTSHTTISQCTHSLVPPLTPPRQLALSLWSNSGRSSLKSCSPACFLPHASKSPQYSARRSQPLTGSSPPPALSSTCMQGTGCQHDTTPCHCVSMAPSSSPVAWPACYIR